MQCLCDHKNNKKKIVGKRTTPEIKAAELLTELGIKYREQWHVPYMATWRMFDFYLPELNILLEIDGTYWHAKGVAEDKLNATQRKNKKNDNIKNELAKSKGYTLVRIWSDDITKAKLKRKLNVP